MKIETWWSDRIKAPEQLKMLIAMFQDMANHALQGVNRYGPPDRKQKYMTRIGLELAAYRKTGSHRHLVNIANYAALEAVAPENGRFHRGDEGASATRGKLGGARESGDAGVYRQSRGMED